MRGGGGLAWAVAVDVAGQGQILEVLYYKKQIKPIFADNIPVRKSITLIKPPVGPVSTAPSESSAGVFIAHASEVT